MKKNLLIVGLGNPGSQYELTRHNIGFRVLDIVAGNLFLSFPSDKKCSQIEWKSSSSNIILLKPMEFMNLSGGCVNKYMKQNAIHIQDILVVHDEIDLPFGEIRRKEGGGHAGHNGLRDIIDKTGSRDFHRIRVGVGRPPHPEFSVADYVLSRFHSGEMDRMGVILKTAKEMVSDWIVHKVPEWKGKEM